jgi:hypothetical protein
MNFLWSDLKMNNRSWIMTLIWMVMQVHSQTILSVNPNSAEQGEYLPVTVTGMNTNFRDYSGMTNLPYLTGKNGNLSSGSVTFPNSNQVNCYFQIPSSYDTGTYSMSFTMRQDIAPYPFKIKPPSGRTVLLGYGPKVGAKGQSEIIRTGIRNPFANRPDRSKWRTHIDSAQKRIEPVECGFESDSSLACSYNFDDQPSILQGNFAVTYNDQPVWTFPGSFYAVSRESEVSLGVVPSSVRAPGDAYRVRIPVQGNIITAFLHYGANINAVLYRGEDSVKAKSATFDRDTTLSLSFRLPKTAESGIWNLSLQMSTNFLIPGNFPAYRFGIVKVDAATNIPVIDSVAPDSFTASTDAELSMDFKRANWNNAPLTSNIWLSNGKRKLNPKSIVLESPNRLRLAFAFGLGETVGYWNVFVVKGADTMSYYNALYLKAPVAKIKKVEADPIYGGGSVRMRIEGSGTRFSIRTDSDYLNAYPSISLGTNPVIPAREIRVVNDSLLFADFAIPLEAKGFSSLQIIQAPPYLSLSLENGLQIQSPGIASQLELVSPDTAIQSEKWLISATASGTDFISAGPALRAALVRDKASLVLRNLVAETPTRLSFKLEVPLDCPVGYYDLIVHTSPTDSLIRFSAFRVSEKREILAWNPRYILMNVQSFHLGVKTRNMNLGNSGAVNVFLTDPSKSKVVWGTGVKVINSDSVEADFGVWGSTLGDIWGLEVGSQINQPGYRSVVISNAVEKVKIIPTKLNSEVLAASQAHLIASVPLRLELTLPKAGRVECIVSSLDGRRIRRDLGTLAPGAYSLPLEDVILSRTGLTFWQAFLDGAVLGQGITMRPTSK